jgi:hypothetical protein
MTLSRDQQQAWLAQWQRAGVALDRQRASELRQMSDEQGLRAAEVLLALANPSAVRPDRRRWSGLVEQQALLHRRVTA